MAGNSSQKERVLLRIAARRRLLNEQQRWNPSCALKRVTFQKEPGA